MIVDVVGRSHDDSSLPLGIGQIFVGSQFRRIDGFFVIDHDARPLRESEPASFGVAQVFGDDGFEGFRLDGLQNPRFLGPPQTAGIHRNENVGRAIFPFGFNPFDEFVPLTFDEIYVNAGLLGKIIVQGSIAVVVTRRVDVYHFFRCCFAGVCSLVCPLVGCRLLGAAYGDRKGGGSHRYKTVLNPFHIDSELLNSKILAIVWVQSQWRLALVWVDSRSPNDRRTRSSRTI